VRSLDHNPAVANACTFHWGKPLYRTIDGESLFDSFIILCLIPLNAGERTRTYTCCSGQTEGCTRGPHVFYETESSLLHARYPFSETSPMTSSALDVAALDCEMIYTTGGFRIARVSVVDASGECVFDEFIKLDDGVEVVCVHISPFPSILNAIRVSLTWMCYP
jgi:RNA exonuclease 1